MALLVQEQPGQYRQLAQAMYQPEYPQQQQQQAQLPTPSPQLMQQFMGGGDGGGFGGFGGGGGSGGSGSSGLSGLASNPYAWLAAALAYKAYDTKKEGGVGYEDQLKNISKAPIGDFDRWGLDKYAPAGGGELYKSTFELASGDVSNWWDRHKKAFGELKDIF